MKTLRQRGFTLIELLVVVAIIGLIVAIAIPALIQAIDRGKQKQTMSDVRTIGLAVEAYAVDTSHYPRIASLTPVAGTLEPHVAPYVPTIPLLDGWSQDIRYEADATGDAYSVISYGKDRLRSPTSIGRTNDFDCDIIYQGGAFFAWPEGIQT